MSDLLAVALRYLAAGLTPLPIEHKTKKPTVSWKQFQTRRPTEAELTRWFGNGSKILSLGTVCGKISGGLLVLDFDVSGLLYEPWADTLGDAISDLPVQRTGGGGVQVMVRTDDPGRNQKLASIQGLDGKWTVAIETRAEAGFTVLPPSLHPSGGYYSWFPDSPRKIPHKPPEFIAMLLNVARSFDQTPEPSEAEIMAGRTYLTGKAGKSKPRGGVIDAYNQAHSVEDLLLSYGYTRQGKFFCRPESPGWHSIWIQDGKSYHHSSNDPLCNGHLNDAFDIFCHFEHDGNVTTAVRAASEMMGMKQEKEKPKPASGKSATSKVALLPEKYPLSDVGNARRLIDVCQGSIIYNEVPFRSWYIWTGKVWQPDETQKIFANTELVTRAIIDEAFNTADMDSRSKLLKWAASTETAKRKRDMVFLASCVQEITFRSDDIDVSPWLLNCQNGTLDLESGEPVFREHNPADRLTKIMPTFYTPGAQCPRWLKFIHEIFSGDADTIQYVQAAVGYSITGDVSEECFFFAYGTGANGKSIFFNTLEILLGNYAGKIPTDALMIQYGSNIPTEIADLKGKRLVVASEIESGKKINEAKIKDLTGHDSITARKLHHDNITFQPTHKLWMFGNHKPDITGDDYGIWRRPKIIPFEVTIPKEKRVIPRILLDGFRQELAGILNWALDGYISYREKGLYEPPSVSNAIKVYREENDIIGQFISEKCAQLSTEYTLLKTLWNCYKDWCIEDGKKYLDARALSKKLRERGYIFEKKTDNKTFVHGLILK